MFGKRNQILKIRKNIEENGSLTLNGHQIEIKEEEKYLRDYLHSLGLSKSVEVTVKKRFGKCIKSVLVLNSVINDFRMHCLGGINVGLDIFQKAILPVLLNNSATWIGMDKVTINKFSTHPSKVPPWGSQLYPPCCNGMGSGDDLCGT